MFHFLSDKRGAILKSALDVFMTYGFRKTSMDDIARAAGVSRPTLYQLFANKADIFRALSQEIMTHAAQAAGAALEGDGTFRDRLYNCIDRSILDMHRFIESTPHGQELLGVNEEIGKDLEQQWCDVMVTTITAGMQEAERRGEIALSDAHEQAGIELEDIARIFMNAMEGLKPDYLEGKPIETKIERLVDFTAISLQQKG